MAATLVAGQSFSSTEQVTNTKLHNLVNLATISDIVNAEISNTASIADTKLATIATAGAVMGSALATLSGIPAGAGEIPVASIPTLSDTKLSQITTASKVSGAALTSLANIPAGAGVIPVANSPTLATLGGVAAGANSSITSLSGLTTPLSTAQGGTGATAAANAASGVVVLNASSQLPAVSGALLTNLPAPANDSISQSKLKTATGEVSTSTSSEQLTLPGGTYGFWPQVKCSPADTLTVSIAEGGNVGTSYATLISAGDLGGGCTFYAQQRYVTASGEDMWIFLLIDKITKEIISAYQAPDHPAYGNGGNFDKLPHPFGSYDVTKQEIVLLDKETCLVLKVESKQTSRSILTLVNEEYGVAYYLEHQYKPLHSGRFLGGKPELVQSIPDYIKVRKLEKLTQADKDAREVINQQRTQEVQEKKRIEDLIEAKERELAIAELKKEGKIRE